MKFFALLLVLTAALAHANYLDATVALKEVLPVGSYAGLTEDDAICTVIVADVANGVKVTVKSEGESLNRVVPFNSVFMWKPGKREFLSTAKTILSNGTEMEDVVRTIAVTDTTQYVVVAKIKTEDRDIAEDARECIINL
jgi:hypothetical protein